MPARRKLRKVAVWTGIATLLIPGWYAGAYFSIVRPVIATEVGEDEKGAIIQSKYNTSPAYPLPWPIPATVNQPWMQQRLYTSFEPIHQLDRWLRPDIWKDVVYTADGGEAD